MPRTESELDLCAAPASPLLLTFLAWLAERPRTYGETMEAWRTSCPRLAVWEDATGHGLVRLANEDATGQAAARVLLTERGALLISKTSQDSYGTPNLRA